MEILEKLFGSSAKVKLLKLYLLNPELTFDAREAGERTKVSVNLARKEIGNLEKIGFIKSKFYTKEVKRQKNRSVETFRKRTTGWTLDPKFPYLEALALFLSNVNPFKNKDIIQKISKALKIQLLIISGIFIKYPEARADLLIVGDNIKMTQLENIIKNIEAEMGKEINYAVLPTEEFKYRYSVFDKLIRDILDYPHEKIINKLNL